MTDASPQAKLVRIKVEVGRTGLYYATSPDLTGLLVAERTLAAVQQAIPGAIKDLYAACGEEVVVTPLADHDDEYSPWVAVPVALAHAQLDGR